MKYFIVKNFEKPEFIKDIYGKLTQNARKAYLFDDVNTAINFKLTPSWGIFAVNVTWSETGVKNGLDYRLCNLWAETDGGRSEAGFKGDTGDCVTRAIAIATEQDYKTVYNDLNELSKRERRKNKSSARTGVHRATYEKYLKSLGWEFIPTMQIGSGCKVHLRPDEIPGGRLILRLSRHLTAFIDGIIYDTFDPSREGTRCVYGYYIKKNH